MKLKAILASVGLMLALALGGVAAVAGPVTGGGGLSGLSAESGLVQKVHQCHRAPAIGPEAGECHIHRRDYDSNCAYYRVPMRECRGDRYDDRRGPRCITECRWIRGERVCDRVCR